jgi:hypothetical protein
VLSVPYVQQRASQITSEKLSAYLGVPVRIESVRVRWINRLVMEGVYVEDQQGKPLIEATHVSAGFRLLPMMRGKYVFTTVRLFGFNLQLEKETPRDALNLQFLIDAFARKDTTRVQPEIDLRLNTVLLRKGHISYHVNSEKQTPGRFNPKHTDISNISANISLKAFNRDSINADVRKLSFDESSGFRMDRLSMNLTGNRDSIGIDRFEIRLPGTHLNIGRAKVDISRVDGLTALFNDAPMELHITPSSTVALKDLAAFVPAFGRFADVISLSAEASGTIDNIGLKRLAVRQDNHLSFDGEMELKGISTPGEAYLFGKVNRMSVTHEGFRSLADGFGRDSLKLPDAVMRLGRVDFRGEISGFFDNLVAFGEISTAIGSLHTDIIFGSDRENNIAAYIKGHAATSGLALSGLFAEGNPFGNARFDATIDVTRPVTGDFKANIQGEVGEFDYRGYKYENILLSGNFNPNGFDGIIEVDDPNGALRAEGIVRNEGNNSVFNFTADLRHFRPDRLNLTDRFEEPEISLRLNADFTGNNIDYAQGRIVLDSLSFNTLPSDFFLEKMEIEASGRAEERRLTISSDIVNGEIVGAYSFHTIVPSFIHTFELYLPSLIRSRKGKEKIEENNFSILLTVENTESLSETFKLPVAIVEPALISGHYNNRYDKFRVEARLPEFRLGKSTFKAGYLSCENPESKVDLQLRATNYSRKGVQNQLNLKADAGEDLINTLISWENNKEEEYRADFSASALFAEDREEGEKPELRVEVSINESPVVVNDTLWTIDPSSVTIKGRKINIDNFRIAHGRKFLHLDGTVSPEASDTLHMSLQEMELGYIFDILNNPVLQFGGQATGDFVINDLYHSRMMQTDLAVENFSFNKVQLGLLNLYSEWDDTQQGILMLGSIYKNDSTWTDVNGYIFPVKPKEGLSLHFDANDIDISFLQPFLANVAKNVKGRGFGHVHLFGSFKELTAEGDAYVEDGGLGIEFLNTYYTFSDSIHLVPEAIRIKDATVYDKFGNTGKVNLDFKHKYFYDYDFEATIQANKILLYDRPKKSNPIIYGTAFGSGSGTIRGNENLIDFDVSVRSEPGTFAGFNFMTSSASAEYDFITFTDKDSLPDKTPATVAAESPTPPLPVATTGGAELRMNFQVDVTPDATIELIMDPASGDRIRGNANGSLQVQYGTRSDLKMYGGLNIMQGNYNFSLQQIIYRDFKIRDGSTVSFQGDPYNAAMNIDAIYSLTANIGELDQHLLQESDRVNVPVDCVLKLDGMLLSPMISFDLELPGSNDEIERQVRSFIDTEDMMIRQVVYLLVLHKFYTPDYANTLDNNRTNEFSAVAASAISSQLSQMLNSITDKVQIGTNIRTSRDKFDDTEVEMLLSSQLLDNRLLFNGNFGYRNSISLQRNVFVGEFDLEYKLTPGGEVRLKAYNHANDMYQYLKQSLFTQGVGILLKKDFDTLRDLFYRRRRTTAPPASH